MTTSSIPAGFDFTDPDLWATRTPIEEFAELRRTAPIWWNEQRDGAGGYHDGGYWVVSKLEDVKEISKDPVLFSSRENTSIIRLPDGISEDQKDLTRAMLVNMDPPKHTQNRRIISKGFTPRAVESLRDALRERAEIIVAEAKKTGGGDFVEQIAVELPLQAIAELLGVPQSDRNKLFDWSNHVNNYDDPEYGGDAIEAYGGLAGYAWNMAEERRKCPVDDIVTKLVNADINGESLATDEFAFFVVLLTVAGNETTRNAITHGMKAFVDNPAQWDLYREQRPRTAPDEIVRWATPVSAFQRTATADTELGGVSIKKGQRLGLFYASANFDEDAFIDPFGFDVLRNPNPHVAFGGTGSHYCVGANLARLEIDLMFNALADVMPRITEVAEPVRLRSGWLNGIKHWQVKYE
ncbi:cytochrome P450 [Nocardia sp. NPDC004123]